MTEIDQFFLGGCDLEMVAIAQLLRAQNNTVVHDRSLEWGVKASEYTTEIDACLKAGHRAVLVELEVDLNLSEAIAAGRVILIDHHRLRSGRAIPTSLEQIFRLLKCPQSGWTREFQLIAANDRGHVSHMHSIGATTEELTEIRKRDREAQGITPEQEADGKTAVDGRETALNDALTIVRLPHTKAATVTDLLEKELGGPGYKNLVIFSPEQTMFFGSGAVIRELIRSHPKSWFGGDLPIRGYWGSSGKIPLETFLNAVTCAPDIRPASEIEVKSFRHIVLWPVLLRGSPNHESESILPGWVDVFTKDARWKAESSEGVHSRFSYEQIVYFHPFVRDFLFGDGDKDVTKRATRILTRDDISGVEVELGQWQPENVRLKFTATRTELYLCKPCVAILVMELTNPMYLDRSGYVTLNELQDFTDQFRRLYPPFWWDWSNKEKSSLPGLCLRSLKWVTSKGQGLVLEPDLPKESISGDPAKQHLRGLKEDFERFTRLGAEPPLFAHWQYLFGPHLRPACTQEDIDSKSPEGLFIQQLLDERMPAMTYYAVDDPTAVSTGDRDRLTFIDASGTDPYPYSEEFLKNNRDRHRYKRFSHYHTDYYCSGYGFAMLGKASDPFYSSILVDHFSHHYFCLGLIAHYQRAALLYFADELAGSIKLLEKKSIGDELFDQAFRDGVEKIQHRFLKFRSRTFYAEVSNQLQGGELFRWWFDMLETQRLFDLVDSNSERLTTVLAERESRGLARVASGSIPLVIGLSVASALFSAKAFDTQFWIVVVISFAAGLITLGIVARGIAWGRRLRKFWFQITRPDPGPTRHD
jgi:hypothetical protein